MIRTHHGSCRSGAARFAAEPAAAPVRCAGGRRDKGMQPPIVSRHR